MSMGAEDVVALTDDERETLAANVCSCYSRPAHIATVLGPAVAQIVSDRLAAEQERLARVDN